MNLTYSSHIIIPKIDGPPTTAPLTRNDESGTTAATIRTVAASTTGPPTTRARKIDRRDHNICPSDRSKIRTADAMNDGVWFDRVTTSPDTEKRPGDCRPATSLHGRLRILPTPRRR